MNSRNNIYIRIYYQVHINLFSFSIQSYNLYILNNYKIIGNIILKFEKYFSIFLIIWTLVTTYLLYFLILIIT